ncbi:MAG: hypothetical protein E6G40_11435 [Actinobacteria bacterium]|nr:MAG: hypothetical protein E6G40_11435 [Actinomycetota bacterium]
MSSRWQAATSEDLERALAQAASFVAYPEVGDLSGVVARRIREAPALAPRRRALPSLRELFRPAARPILQPAWLKAAVAVAVAVAMFTGTLVLSPTARHAVAGWLGLRGVKIEIVPSPSITVPRLLGTGLDLGDRVTLAEAQPQVPFEILFPAELGPPDELYLRTDLAVDEVTLVYRARPGLPAAAATGEGLLIGEFQAGIDNQLIEKKVGSQATKIEPVSVDGQPGYWIEGAHEVYLIGPDGEQLADTVRLAGNVLLWEKGKVTLRLEADISKAEALRIARSVG